MADQQNPPLPPPADAQTAGPPEKTAPDPAQAQGSAPVAKQEPVVRGRARVILGTDVLVAKTIQDGLEAAEKPPVARGRGAIGLGQPPPETPDDDKSGD